jgi:hypothetical protein
MYGHAWMELPYFTSIRRKARHGASPFPLDPDIDIISCDKVDNLKLSAFMFIKSNDLSEREASVSRPVGKGSGLVTESPQNTPDTVDAASMAQIDCTLKDIIASKEEYYG